MPTVSCHSIAPVSWHNPSVVACRVIDEIHIWRIKISENLLLIDTLTPFLSEPELLRANTYHHARDRQRFILCRGMLRYLLSRYLCTKPGDIQFTTGKNQKPFVTAVHKHPVHYNVAHSGDLVLIAIAGTPLGIDIEYIDEKFAFSEILPACFSSTEALLIQSAPYPTLVFYLLWTRKESLAKATAKGIDDDLALMPCLDGDHEIASEIIGSEQNWQVTSFEMEPTYKSSIAHDPDVQNIRFLEAAISWPSQ